MELGNSREAIKHAVMYEMGISCLSRRVIQDQIESGSLKRDKGRRSKITTYFYILVYHRQNMSLDALKKLLSYS